MKIYDSVLKPCPFCGNKTSVHAYTYKDAVYRQYAVKCNKCGARIMGASTELAIDKWNRRVTPEVKTQYRDSPLEHPEVVHCNECFYAESVDDKDDLTALRAFWAEQQANAPLTWEQLKGMEGKPVWVEVYDPIDEKTGWHTASWKLIEFINDEYFDVRDSDGEQECFYKSENDWQAYRKERTNENTR